jgi:hypothetical protein
VVIELSRHHFATMAQLTRPLVLGPITAIRAVLGSRARVRHLFDPSRARDAMKGELLLRDTSAIEEQGMSPWTAGYLLVLTVVARTAGTDPVVAGARPSCWAMIAAWTTWRSDGSMGSGPPDTGTCHTWVIIGVVPSAVVPGLQGAKPSI